MNKNFIPSDIIEMVNEALGEITRKGQSVQSAPVNTPTANAPKNPKLIARPVCRLAYYGKPDANGNEKLTVRLDNIHAAHQNDLINQWSQKYGQIFTAHINQSQKFGNSSAPMDLTVTPGQEDTFEKIVPNLVQDIANENGVKGMSYDQNFLNGLQLSILGRIDEAPSQEDFEKAQTRQRANLKDIITKLQDPDFVKKLGFVGGVSVNSYSNIKDIVKNAQSVGWRISALNQLMVKSYLPTATFVTNAWTWEHVFNREVIDPNQFAFMVKASNDKPKDINSRMQAAAQLGYIDTQNTSKNPWDVYKSLNSQLSQAQKVAVEFLSNILNPNSANFVRQKVYDVSNTRLIPGMPDVWNEEVNFEDNIKGIPNAKAQEYLAGLQGQSGTTAQTQVTQWQPKGEEEIGDLITILSALCSKHCGRTPNTVAGDSLGDTIAHFADFYARYHICPNRNIVKSDQVDATCNAFAIGLAAIYGFQVQRRGNQLTNALKDPEFEKRFNELYQDFMDLVSEINVELLKMSSKRRKAAMPKKQVSESVCEGNMISFDQFKNLLLGGGNLEESEDIFEDETMDEVTPETVEESFFKMLDKIEHING